MSLNPNDANVYVDFPGGWRYGFPRLYLNPTNLNNRDYLLATGVPDWLATQEQDRVTKWTKPSGTVPLKGLTDIEKEF